MSEQGMLLPGQRLRAEREARGLSQDEVARRLNLTVTFLEALEADEYERLPEATFVRGYIRNYARELDLPGDELVSLFSEIMREREDVPETVEVMPARNRRWIPVVLVVVVLMAAAGMVLWFDDDTAAEGAVNEDPVAASEQSEPAGDSEADESGSSGPDESDSAPEEPADADTPDAQELEPVRLAEGRSNQDAPADETAATDQLEMRFSGECWLEVRDATGEVVFEGRRDAGVALTVSGQAPFDLRIGDASAVSALSVNDEQQTVPGGGSGQVVYLSVP